MIITPKPYFTRTIHLPGLGRKESPAPANGQGKPMPKPSRKGSNRPTVMPLACRVVACNKTEITTGATQAPASKAATVPMV